MIALKGPLLSKRLFNDVTKRQCRDLDLIVDKDKVFVVAQLLEKHGYERIDALHAINGDQDDYLTYFHHINLYHPVKGVLVELHWRPFGRRWGKSFQYQTISSELSAIKILDQDSEFVYLCIHAYKHGWMRLKWLFDVFTLMQKQSYEYLFDMERWRPFHNELRDTMFLAKYYFDRGVTPQSKSEIKAIDVSEFYQKLADLNMDEVTYTERIRLGVKRKFLEYKRSGFKGMYQELWFAFFGAQFYKINTESKLPKYLLAPFYYILQLRKV